MTTDTSITIGRPTKLTALTVKKLETAFRLGASVSFACSYAKISRQTFYIAMQNNPEFRDRMCDAKEYLNIAARMAVAHAIVVMKDSCIALDYLKATDPQFQPRRWHTSLFGK